MFSFFLQMDYGNQEQVKKIDDKCTVGQLLAWCMNGSNLFKQKFNKIF